MKVFVLIGLTDHEPSDVLGIYSTYELAMAARDQDAGTNTYDAYSIESFQLVTN